MTTSERLKTIRDSLDQRMNEFKAKLWQAIMDQREVVIASFIAETGCYPHEAIQIHDGDKWYVRAMTPEEKERALVSQQAHKTVESVHTLPLKRFDHVHYGEDGNYMDESSSGEYYRVEDVHRLLNTIMESFK